VEVDVRGECPVCRSPLLFEPRVACRSCRALHHRECWVYNGQCCAIYGCPGAERDPLPSLPAGLGDPARTEPSFFELNLSTSDWILLGAVIAIAAAKLIFRA
jgi:hypothetical protein